MPAADKIRSEMAATTGDLSSRLAAERASAEQLAATSDELRLQLGGVKQQMAKNAAELQRERQIAAEMKERVKAINQTYQASGDVLRSELESAKRTPSALAQLVPVEMLRNQLGSSSQALAQADDRLKWVPCCCRVLPWHCCLADRSIDRLLRSSGLWCTACNHQHPLLLLSPPADTHALPPPPPPCRALAAALRAADKKMDKVRAQVRGLQGELRQAEARPVGSGQAEELRRALAGAQDELKDSVHYMQ